MTTKTLKLWQTHDMLNGRWYEIGSAAHKALAMEQGVPADAYAEYVNSNTTPRICIYDIEYDTTKKTYGFRITETYDSSKKWFEQRGIYWNKNEDIQIRKKESNYYFSYNHKFYRGTINAEGTLFTGTEEGSGSGTITVDITDKGNGTVSITVESNTYTLDFKGDSTSL